MLELGLKYFDETDRLRFRFGLNGDKVDILKLSIPDDAVFAPGFDWDTIHALVRMYVKYNYATHREMTPRQLEFFADETIRNGGNLDAAYESLVDSMFAIDEGHRVGEQTFAVIPEDDIRFLFSLRGYGSNVDDIFVYEPDKTLFSSVLMAR